MTDRIFIPFPNEDSEPHYGGSDYGERILRSGRNTFNEKHGHTAAFVIQWDNRQPCPRCGRPLLAGQYGRFHRDYSDELVHDGCADYEHPAEPKSYVIHGKREPPYCSKCFCFHVGECP